MGGSKIDPMYNDPDNKGLPKNRIKGEAKGAERLQLIMQAIRAKARGAKATQ